MPRLSSRSKHVEFGSNSALQIRNQKERRAEEAGKSSSEISQKGVKILHLRNSHSTKFLHSAKMFALLTNFFKFSQITPFVIVLVHVIW